MTTTSSPPSLDLLVLAPRAVLPGSEQERSVVVGVREGRICSIEELPEGGEVQAALPPAAQTLRLAPDEVLLPGLVDTHVHVNEPGRTEWEGFASATRAAAAGGVTTLLDMPLNSVPPTVTLPALRLKQEAARDQVAVDVGFWGGAVPDHLDDLTVLHEAGVFGFKCFLADSGVAEFPHLEPEVFAEAMARTARLGALMIVHAEDAGVLERAAPPHGGTLDYDGFLATRPTDAETLAIGLVLDQARRTGGRAHVLHLSAADALTQLRPARAEGVDVSVETCPHYLTLTAEDVPAGGTQFKCCPPIRESGNRDRLWRGLQEGDIDLVVSDHSPSTADLKRLDTGDFGAAWGGIASVQLGLPAVWDEARRRGVPLARVVRWMATNPADRVGLGTKGRLAVGADADLVVFAPEEAWDVDVTRLKHKTPVAAYAGRHLVGRVRQTYLRGEPVRDGRPAGGRLLERPR